MNDYTENEIILIKNTMQNFKPLIPLEQVYTIEEVIECENRIGFELPVSFTNYITKISREFRYNVLGFKVIFDISKLNKDSKDIYLNGNRCSEDYKLYIQGKRKNTVYNWQRYDGYGTTPTKCFNNFKEFVMSKITHPV